MATPPDTTPFRSRTTAWRVAQAALMLVVVWLAWRGVANDWPQVTRAWQNMHVSVGPLALSGLVVIATYALLIETWRQTVTTWGGHLSYGTAARIWFVSNLGKYLPGKIWQITAMGALTAQAGVPATAAIGSSLLIAAVNLIAGFVVVAVAPTQQIAPAAAVYAVIIAASALALSPTMLPAFVRWIGARFGRDVTMPAIPRRTLIIAFAGCTVGWLLHGIAFKLLVVATVGDAASGSLRDYIAVFTFSYLIGYISVFAPGGFGPRELVLAALLDKLALAPVAVATVIIVLSRLWLTVLELVPGLVLLALTPKPTTPRGKDV